MEETVRENEKRLREAMEATNDGLWDWNLKTDEAYYSPAYYRMLDYEPGEFPNDMQLGYAFWKEHIHPDNRDRALKANEDCIENRVSNFEMEFRMRAKGGEWKWILGRGKATDRDKRRSARSE